MVVAKKKLVISADEVKDFAAGQGADCTGIAKAETLSLLTPAQSPFSVLPGAQSVIAIGITTLDGPYDNELRGIGTISVVSAMNEVNRISFQIGRLLERSGYRAAPVPAGFPFEFTRENKGIMADISLKHAAVAAGLGVRGLSSLLITPQWGPRIRIGAVITNAPLDSDGPLDEDLCTDCNLCVEACPAGAVSPEGNLDYFKCAERYLPFGFRKCVSFVSELFSKTDEEKQKALKNLFFWNAYMSLFMEPGLCGCFECVKICPVSE